MITYLRVQPHVPIDKDRSPSLQGMNECGLVSISMNYVFLFFFLNLHYVILDLLASRFEYCFEKKNGFSGWFLAYVFEEAKGKKKDMKKVVNTIGESDGGS